MATLESKQCEICKKPAPDGEECTYCERWVCSDCQRKGIAIRHDVTVCDECFDGLMIGYSSGAIGSRNLPRRDDD